MADLGIKASDLMPDHRVNNYFLLSDKNILEICRDVAATEYTEFDEIQGMLNGTADLSYSYYMSDAERDALNNIWNKLSSETGYKIEDRIKDFLAKDMVVRDEFEEYDDEKVPYKDVRFPSIKGSDNILGEGFELNVEDVDSYYRPWQENSEWDKITKEQIAEYAYMNDMLEINNPIVFCEKNGIDISDLVEYDILRFYDEECAMSVVVEAKDFKSPEDMSKALQGDIELINNWNDGNVYGYVLYNRDGDELDSCYGFFGEQSLLEDGMNLPEGVTVVANLGLHTSLEACLGEANLPSLDLDEINTDAPHYYLLEGGRIAEVAQFLHSDNPRDGEKSTMITFEDNRQSPDNNPHQSWEDMLKLYDITPTGDREKDFEMMEKVALRKDGVVMLPVCVDNNGEYQSFKYSSAYLKNEMVGIIAAPLDGSSINTLRAELRDQVEAYSNWANDEVYEINVYDKDMKDKEWKFGDYAGPLYHKGDICIYIKDSDIDKDLGVHASIYDCVLANKDELDKSEKAKDKRLDKDEH